MSEKNQKDTKESANKRVGGRGEEYGVLTVSIFISI